MKTMNIDAYIEKTKKELDDFKAWRKEKEKEDPVMWKNDLTDEQWKELELNERFNMSLFSLW